MGNTTSETLDNKNDNPDTIPIKKRDENTEINKQRIEETVEKRNEHIFEINVEISENNTKQKKPFLFVCAESNNNMLTIEVLEYKDTIFMKQFKFEGGKFYSSTGSWDKLHYGVQVGGETAYRLICGQSYTNETENIITNKLNRIIDKLNKINVTYKYYDSIEKIIKWRSGENSPVKSIQLEFTNNSIPNEIIDPSIITQLEQIDILLKRKNNIEQLLNLLNS